MSAKAVTMAMTQAPTCKASSLFNDEELLFLNRLAFYLLA